MEIQNTFYNMASTPDICTTLKAQGNKTALDLNCMRIGIVQEFYPEDLTVSVLIANKKEINLNYSGSQNVRNYALIRAKICYCNPFISCEIKSGDECVLLFSDREIESWFINGDVNPLAYSRMHDLTDAVAIFGIRSMPQMVEIMQNCLHLFHPQKVLADNFHASNGASGNITDSNGKVLASVVDGIITEIF